MEAGQSDRPQTCHIAASCSAAISASKTIAGEPNCARRCFRCSKQPSGCWRRFRLSKVVSPSIPRQVKAPVCAAATWLLASSLFVYPHSLSYFNEAIGGPRNGFEHLHNSNIDWGQDLLFLKRWLDKHPEAPLDGFAYSLELIQPSVVGVDIPPPPFDIRYRSSNKADESKAGPLPGRYAVSVNYLHDRHHRFNYFSRLTPFRYIGYSIVIYEITPAQANRLRDELEMRKLPRETTANNASRKLRGGR